MQNNPNLYKTLKQTLKEMRFGNLSNRISPQNFPEDTDFINDFNAMIEAFNDREKMIAEYQKYIEDQSEHLKSLFNMLNEGAMTLSEDFKILSINDTQVQWFKKTKKSLIGADFLKILNIYKISEYPTGKIRTNHLEFFEKDRKNYALTFEFKKIKMTFNISIKKFLDKNGKQNYFIVAKDITSQVELEKLKDTFIATLTHDLKVPILAEAKVLELLLKESFGKNSKEQKEAFENMLSNNKDMTSLVTTLLDVYKLENGAYKLKKSSCNIMEILQTEINKLKYLAEENNCKIEILSTKKLPNITVDEKEISRVLKNVLTNAISFAPANTSVKIKTEKDKENIYIRITDNGCGIEEKDIPFIFNRYFGTDKKYRKVGTGLGLYLSKQIINLHNGDIWAESKVNKATTFSIKLPI